MLKIKKHDYLIDISLMNEDERIKGLDDSEIEATEKIIDIVNNFSLEKDNPWLSEPENHSLRKEFPVEDLKKFVIPVLVLDWFFYLPNILKSKKIDILLKKMNEHDLLIFFSDDSLKEFVNEKMDIPRSLIRHINHHSVISDWESEGDEFRSFALCYKEYRLPECVFMVSKKSTEEYLSLL